MKSIKKTAPDMFDFLFGWRKASNCKKLIRRVQCRLKLLKNKRCSIVRQSRDDVAQLLKYGLEQSAFDRVEQIFKDESIVAVYDLLDHFCEFIVIHLSYIRKHKDCPNDINEAVSSLIFASARCGDLPELLVIRKLFGERYGQRFALVALELLPGNLVNQQIKENLSIKSVPNDVKYKLVDEIARSCLEPGPLAIEYYSELQLEQMNKSKGDQVVGSDVQKNCHKSEEHQVQEFSIMEGEGKIVHVDFTSDSRDLFIEPCHSHQGSDATGGSISPFSLPWSVNEKDEWRVGNYAHLRSPYESKILPPSVDKEVGMAVESSSDSPYRLPKETICLDDVEEFISTTSKDGNGQDQRLFLFKSSVNIETGRVEDVLDESNLDKSEKSINDKAASRSSRKSRKVPGKRHRMRSVSKEGLYAKDFESTIYYGGSLDDSRNDNLRSHHRRKHHKRTPLDETRKSFGAQARLGQPWHHLNNGNDRTVHECSLEDPCYFCTSDNKDECGSKTRMITTLEEFPAHKVNEGKVGNNSCCPNCQHFWNGESNNREMKWALVLHKPSRDYQMGVIVPNEMTKKVAKSDGFSHPPYLRAVTMPVERPSDCRVDSMLRLNSYPFPQASHVHPKLPDYDQLAEKFTALKKANLECKSNQVTLAA